MRQNARLGINGINYQLRLPSVKRAGSRRAVGKKRISVFQFVCMNNKWRLCLCLVKKRTRSWIQDTIQVFMCCNKCASSVWLWGIFRRVRGWRLLLVYEGQQEECYVMGAPVACVWGHRWPIATLHQTLPELKVNASLQLQWCVSSGWGGSSHGGEAVCRLAFCPLLLLFLSVWASLKT